MKYDDISMEYKYGTFTKKELYEKECKDPKNI